MTQALEIRDYRPEDGAACYTLRREAFLNVFAGFLPGHIVQAGADSYGQLEFAERIAAMDTFVAWVGGEFAGFCTVRLLSPERAELLYLYVVDQQQGRGVGARLVRHAEQRVRSAHPALETLFLDTAVPDYNQGFWEHVGYQPAGQSFCDYPTGKIPALRLEKQLAGLGTRGPG
ncbi:MAG: GNAT family N-acetyltransferase [Anaerolineae bacterium]|jgi:GNAT superfamily N-acetyltransferase